MRFSIACPFLFLVSCGTTRVTSNVGYSDFGSDLEPVETHTIVGLEMSQVPEAGGLGYEFGLRYGKDTGVLAGISATAESNEIYGGPRYEWALNNWHPYLSGGVSALRVRGGFEDLPSQDENDIGYYLSTGVDYQMGEILFLGFGLRKTFDHDGFSYGNLGEADAWQYLLRFGLRF